MTPTLATPLLTRGASNSVKVATAVSAIGDAALIGGCVYFAAGLDDAAFWLPVFLASQALGLMLAAGMTKTAATKLPAIRLISRASVGAALINMSAWIVMTDQAALLAILLLLDAVLSAVAYAVTTSQVSSLASPERLSKQLGGLQAARLVGSLAGLPLGSYLVDAMGVKVLLLMNATSYLTYVAVLRRALPDTTRGYGPSRVGAERLTSREGIGSQVVRSATVFFALCIAGTVVVDTAAVIHVRSLLGEHAALTGLVLVCWPVGAVMANRLPATQTTSGNLRGLCGASIAIGFSAIAVGLAGAVVVVCLALFFGGVCLGLQNRSASTLVALTSAEGPTRASAFAQLGALANGGALVGFLVSGLLIAAVGPSNALWLSGAATAGLGGVAVLMSLTAWTTRLLPSEVSE